MLRTLAGALFCAAQGLAQVSAKGVAIGIVVDEGTGAPLGGAHVALGRVAGLSALTATTSGADGKFRFTGLEAGRYWIECSRTGYVKLHGYTLDGPLFDVPSGGEGNFVTLRLVAAASIEGRLASETGEPIPDTEVEAYLSRVSGSTTDPEGRFRIEGLPPGEYKLRARLNDQYRGEQTKVNPNTRERLGLPQIVFYPNSTDASSSVSIRVAKGEQLRGLEFRVYQVRLVSLGGVVIDSRTGAPLERGEIELRPAGLALFGDGVPRRPMDGGRFRFDLLPRAAYQAHVYRSADLGATPFVTTIEAATTDVDDLRIVLPSGGRLAGTVRYPKNSGLTTLHLTPEGSWSSSEAPIRPDGTFAFDGLAPGKWSFGFGGSVSAVRITFASIRQKGRLLRGTIVVVDGENEPLDIEMAELFQVSGTVVDQTGQPVDGATVVFSDGNQSFHWSGKEGNFLIGVVAGEYKVSAWLKRASENMPSCQTTRIVRVTSNINGLRVTLCPSVP